MKKEPDQNSVLSRTICDAEKNFWVVLYFCGGIIGNRWFLAICRILDRSEWVETLRERDP
jgi:hypothetical protein